MQSNKYYFSSYSPGHRQQKTKGSFKLWLILVLLVAVTIVIICSLDSTHKSYAKTVKLPSQSIISSVIDNNKQYQIGVALENISTNQVQTYGLNVPFEAASTSKVIMACAYYHLVEKKQASLDTLLGSYSASYQIREMVNDSDNDSWALIENAVGDDELEAYSQSIGIGYAVDGNLLSPSDMAKFLDELYKGKVLNAVDTKQLLSYMQNTNDESLIPGAVPSDVTVYHKYGLLGGKLHDVAILVKGKSAYVLTIYTNDDSGLASIDSRTDVIHQITKAAINQIGFE
jgi:beta-lactamase class A